VDASVNDNTLRNGLMGNMMMMMMMIAQFFQRHQQHHAKQTKSHQA
jgi:hypothetical protein